VTIEGLQSASQPTGLPPLPAVQTALQILLDASRRAAELQRPRWEFAVEIHELRAAGVPTSTLRWLVCQAYAQHAQETTGPRDVTRQFQPVHSLVFTDRTSFLLTKEGAALARDGHDLENTAAATRSQPALPNGQETPGNGDKPHWLIDLRELRYLGQLVKRFRVPAPNQEVVLATFEEDGWPPHIDDPLPQQVEIDPGRRLHDTVNSLNRNQRHPLLRFGADGTASGIYWEPR